MASSSSSPSGDLVEKELALEEVKEVIFGANLKIHPGLLPSFKPASSSHRSQQEEEEETSLFRYSEENSEHYGGGKLIISSSSLSIKLIPSPPLSSFVINKLAATSQDMILDQNGDNGNGNMTAEIKTTVDGQKQQHLHQKKRDRQDDISGVATSTKRKCTSTTYVLAEEEKSQQRNEELSHSKLREEVAEESIIDLPDNKSRPPVIDYDTALQEHKYYAFGSQPVNLFEASDLLKCITNVYPVDQRSELEREIGMFSRDWLTHHRDPTIQYLDNYLHAGCDRDMKKIYESEVYIQVHNLVKTFDKKTVLELKSFTDKMPMTKEVFNYDMNWALVDKYVLPEKMRPWISNIAKNSTDEEADFLVSDILESMINHGSAVSIHEKIMSFRLVDEVESERLFVKIWEMLFFIIKKLEEGANRIPSVSPCELLSELEQEITEVGYTLSQQDQDPHDEGDRDNYHLLLNFSETVDGKKVETKKIEDVLSLEINWAVFEQNELHEKMRPWIKREVMQLLKKEKDRVVDQVVNCIKEQNHPSQMLELLEPSLDVYTETVVRILWRTLLILVKILETGFPESISSANSNSELSNMEGKNYMSSDDNSCQHKSVWNIEESVESVNKRNRCYSYPSFWHQKKMLDFDTLCEVNRLGNGIPRDLEKVSSYRVDWAVSDKEELRNRLKPWISREIKELLGHGEAATHVVESILSRIKDHANAKDILELVRPSLGDRSAKFVLHLWTQLVFLIQLAGTTGLDVFSAIVRERSAGEKAIVSQYGDRYSRNRHFMMVAFDYENLCKLKRINEAMPKTKADLFSYEIKWDVYEKYDLQKNMRKGIWVETLDLIRQRKEAMSVDEQIMWNIFDYHVSASQREFSAQKEAIAVFEEIMSRLDKDRACPSKMVEYLEPILGSGSEKFVMRMWYALICGIKLAEHRIEKKLKGGSMVLLPVLPKTTFGGFPVMC